MKLVRLVDRVGGRRPVGFVEMVFVGWGLVGMFLGGCASHGGSTRASAVPPAGHGEKSDGARAAAEPRAVCELAGPHALSRAVFSKYLAAGPGQLLAHVAIRRYPKRQEGPFRGWFVLSVSDPCLALVLRPGDVVMAVDGRVIERPEDLWHVWKSLRDAKHLTILRLRDGRIDRLGLDIVD